VLCRNYVKAPCVCGVCVVFCCSCFLLCPCVWIYIYVYICIHIYICKYTGCIYIYIHPVPHWAFCSCTRECGASLFIHTCGMTHPQRREAPSHSYVWHEDTPFPIPMCHMNWVTWEALIHSCMWHGSHSFTRVTWLIHMCDMTHSHVWHDSFTCVTWLIHSEARHSRLICVTSRQAFTPS